MKTVRAAAVADIRKDRADALADRYGIRAYTDYRVMIEAERPHVAIVTLPHYLHKEATVYCAGQGCHLLLEKPMAINVDECDEIMAAASQGGIQLMVGLTQHYLAENRKTKELIRRGELGELVMVQDTRHQYYYHDSRPDWFLEKAKAGGGVMMNLGAHSIDKIQWLTDRRIVKVKASVSHHGKRGDVEGSGIVFAETDSGIPATLFQSGYAGVPWSETEFVFTGGMLRLQTGAGLWISENGAYKEVPVDDRTDPFVLQLRDLLAAIEGERVLECSGEYARSINAVLEGLYRSHETGAEVRVTPAAEA